MREHVDLPTLDALHEEWRLRPPVHLLVAAYIGYKPHESRRVDEETDIAPLLSEMGDIPIRKVMPIDTSAFDALQQQKRDNHG